MHGLTAVGDILADYTPLPSSGRSRYDFMTNIGGTATNCAAAASRLGLTTMLVGRTGNDFMGEYAVDILRDYGVDTSQISRDSERFTAHNFISLDADGERHFTFGTRSSAFQQLGLEHVDLDSAFDCRMLYLTGMALVDGPILATTNSFVREARLLGLPVAFDLNYRDPLFSGLSRFQDRVGRILPYISFIKGARDEFEVVLGTRDLAELGERLSAAGPELIIMTEDGHGASYWWDGAARHFDAVDVEVVDTTGAGDCFMGAALSGLDRIGGLPALSHELLAGIMERANAAAAICTSGFGAVPPLPDPDAVERCLEGAELGATFAKVV